MEGGTLPDVVAEAIYRAATENGPLYVPVGDDADVLAVARARATPDEWVSIHADPVEQRFFDRFTQLCSADILNPPSLNARRKSRVRAVSTPPAVQRFLALVTASWVTASLHTVAVLGIADLLADGPRSAEDLAQATETRPDPLRRLLRALAAHRVFAESADGHFEQTELSGFLREGVVGSLRSFLLMLSGEVISPSWGQMLHSISTGETAFAKVHGCELFEYMQQDQDFAATFNRAMTESSAGGADEIVASYGFSRFAPLVHVGGGRRRRAGLAAVGDPDCDPRGARHPVRPAACHRNGWSRRHRARRRAPLRTDYRELFRVRSRRRERVHHEVDHPRLE